MEIDCPRNKVFEENVKTKIGLVNRNSEIDIPIYFGRTFVTILNIKFS